MTKMTPPCLFAVLLLSGCSSTSIARDLPPEFKPYQLPTYKGNEPIVSDRMPAYIKAPEIDAEAIYYTALNCYPNLSKWNMSVQLKGGISTDEISDEGTSLGSNYMGIVASMPLFDSKDFDRSIKNEHDLRNEVAADVAKFIKAVSDRNNSIRKIDLYSSLESRSSIRVQRGIVDAKEQVGYLEKLAKANESYLIARSDIMTSRIGISSLCAGTDVKKMNDYLKKLSVIPTVKHIKTAKK